MTNKELIDACHDLAKESFEYMKLKKEAADRGEKLTEDELYDRTHTDGSWKKYLSAGGSRTMINNQLSKGDDFGGQYKKMCEEAGLEEI